MGTLTHNPKPHNDSTEDTMFRVTQITNYPTMSTAIQTDLSGLGSGWTIVCAQHANEAEALAAGVPADKLGELVYNQFIDGRTLPRLIRKVQGFEGQLCLFP